MRPVSACTGPPNQGDLASDPGGGTVDATAIRPGGARASARPAAGAFRRVAAHGARTYKLDYGVCHKMLRSSTIRETPQCRRPNATKTVFRDTTL